MVMQVLFFIHVFYLLCSINKGKPARMAPPVIRSVSDMTLALNVSTITAVSVRGNRDHVTRGFNSVRLTN